MFNKKLVLPTVLLTTISIFATASTGFAAEFSPCDDPVGYNCTTGGYKGKSGDYNFENSSQPNDAGKMHNCTAYIGFKLTSYTPKNLKYNELGMAALWGTRANSPAFAALGVTVGNVPHVNDVAQWNFGHVAWVERVIYRNGKIYSIEITEDNFDLGSTVRELVFKEGTQPHKWPDNFITFPPKASSGGSGSGGSDGGDSGGSDEGSSGGQPAGRGKWGALPIEAVAPTPDENY